ncbi:MAG: TRAP transporter large permease subunit, partial [Marinosulfonomonas sp.]|nr:TRAP transporter large permease subunit [Marinosulfonomonas sp.]
IYAGVATPTEAGALGALSALIISVFKGKFSFPVLAQSVRETAITTARIFFIVIGAVLFSRFIAQAGVASYFADLIVQNQPSDLMIVLFSAALFIVLGMFLDTLGLLLLTLPILIPMYDAAGLNMLWFGVLTVKFVEIGMITPPVGLNVYVLKSVVGKTVPLGTIFRGCSWFLLCEVFICAALISFPAISLFLVDTMN